MDAQLQRELDVVISKLKGLEPLVKKSGRQDLREAAKVLATAIAAKTPVGTRPHSRYSTNKGKRAAKGSGNVIARYRQGNLRRSIRVLNFRRSPDAWVGAKRGKNPDGYYAHMVERGTVYQRGQFFFQSGLAAAGGETIKKAITLISARIQGYAKSNGL
jgi:HK97 gp10 family phage protein